MKAVRRVVAAALVATAVAIGALALQGPPDDVNVASGAPPELAAEILTAAQECLKNTSDTEGDGPEACVTDQLQQAALLYGIGTARAAMDILAKDPQVRGCHFMAHALGHVAVARYPLEEVATYGFLHCDSGFYDGAVMALGENFADNTEQELVDATTTLCVGDGTLSDHVTAVCHHGLGHILTERHSRDFDESVRACSILPDTAEWHDGPAARPFSWRASCLSGVIMEFRNNPQEVDSSLQHATELCRGFTGMDLDVCVEFTGITDIVSRDSDGGEYLRWCRDQEFLRGTSECYARTGQWAFFTQDAHVLLPLCVTLARSDDDQMACAYGYAEGAFRAGEAWEPETTVAEGCAKFPQYCELFRAATPALAARSDGSDDFPAPGV